MTLEQINKYFGSSRQIAQLLGISRQAIDNWRRRGYVPIKRQLIIEKLTCGQLKADLRHSEIKR